MASPESTELKPQIITKQEISLRRKLKAECGNKSKGLIPSFRINYDRRKLPYLFPSHCFYNVTGHYGFPSISFFPTAGVYMRNCTCSEETRHPSHHHLHLGNTPGFFSFGSFSYLRACPSYHMT